MRIRTVKPEWLEDEDLAMASLEARVMSIALILSADDEGRLRCFAPVLAGRVFPGRADAADLTSRALGELESTGFLVRYEVDGKQYAFIPGFQRHQKIDRPTASKLPPPPEPSTSPPEPSTSPRRALDEPSRHSAEDSEQISVGREGKGKEVVVAHARTREDSPSDDGDPGRPLDEPSDTRPRQGAEAVELGPSWQPSQSQSANLEIGAAVPSFAVGLLAAAFRSINMGKTDTPERWDRAFGRWAMREWSKNRQAYTEPKSETSGKVIMVDY